MAAAGRRSGGGLDKHKNGPPLQPSVHLAHERLPVSIIHETKNDGASGQHGFQSPELNSFGGSDVGKGLDVHPTHQLGALRGAVQAHEVQTFNRNDHSQTSGHGHHEGADHSPLPQAPTHHDHGMTKQPTHGKGKEIY